MVDGRRKHHFVKSSHFLKNHQIIQNIQNLLGPKRAIRFLSSSLRVEISRCGRRSRRGRHIFSPLSNELHMPALLWQRHLNFAVRCCTRLARYNFKFSESSRTAGPKPPRSIVRIAISFHRIPFCALQLTQKSLAVQCRKICDGRFIPYVPY